MRINIKLSAYVDDANIPQILTEEEYFKEVFKENIEDVLLGMDLTDVDIETIYIDLNG